MQRLEERLGAPFRGSIPDMHSANLTSHLEMMQVRFNSDSLSIHQTGAITLARFLDVAGDAWAETSEHLSVGGEVVRCGFRVISFWETATIEDARAKLIASGLVGPPSPWTEIFGPAAGATLMGIHDDPKWRLRAGIDAIEHKIEGELTPGQEGLFPKAAIQLDVDFIRNGEETAPHHLGKGELRQFVRDGWASYALARQRLAPILIEAEAKTV